MAVVRRRCPSSRPTVGRPTLLMTPCEAQVCRQSWRRSPGQSGLLANLAPEAVQPASSPSNAASSIAGQSGVSTMEPLRTSSAKRLPWKGVLSFTARLPLAASMLSEGRGIMFNRTCRPLPPGSAPAFYAVHATSGAAPSSRVRVRVGRWRIAAPVSLSAWTRSN